MGLGTLCSFVDVRKDTESMLLVFVNHLSWRSVFGAKMRCDELIILAGQCDVVANFCTSCRAWIDIHRSAAIG